MARIAGINIPPHKHAEIGLTAIYGIGRTTAQKICSSCGIPYDKKIKDLTDSDLEKIRDEVGRLTIEGEATGAGAHLVYTQRSHRPVGTIDLEQVYAATISRRQIHLRGLHVLQR